jgi:hypothetical protein
VFLIDRDGRPDFVKIVDFGIAKVQPLHGAVAGPRLTRTGAVIGTPEYMAPEQASGRGDTDHRVDIYALGTMLYEMLVGRVPHKDRSLVRTIAMQMLDPITPPSQVRPDVEIAPELEAIVMKALAKNRDERYATMAEFYAALEGVMPILDGSAAEARAPSSEPSAVTTPMPPPSGPRRARPSTRQLHEPEFVAGPLTLPAPPEDEMPPLPERSARWPWLMLVLVGGVAGIGYLLWGRSSEHSERVAVVIDARESAHDAGLPLELDAMAVVEVTPDAALPAHDAGVRVVSASHDAGVTLVGPHPAKVTIQVITRPGEANVFIDGHFRGPSMTNITEPYGTHATVECKAPHYKGTKAVVFDGTVTSVMCTATRLPFCVEGLHNPIDDCEPRPATGPITSPDRATPGGPVITPRP